MTSPTPADVERLLEEATPGPWCIAPDIHEPRFGIASEAGVVVVAPFIPGRSPAGVQGAENARLIAAAPYIARAYLDAEKKLAAQAEEIKRLREAVTTQAAKLQNRYERILASISDEDTEIEEAASHLGSAAADLRDALRVDLPSPPALTGSEG